MMKTFITLLAVVGFTLSATAQRKATTVDNKAKEQQRREQEMTPKERQAKAAKEEINGAREANESKKISNTEMKLEDFSLIKDQGTRDKLVELAKDYDSNVNSDGNFTVKVASILVKIAKSTANESEKAQILKFVEESMTLMSLKGESGSAARNAMSVLAKALSEGKSLNDGIYLSMKAAFPKLSEKELQEKIAEFKKNCLGQA